jgi:Acyl-CoA dehydrogenase, C-terminal domain
MDRDDLELFSRSLHHAFELHSGAALDDALAELGWSEALASDRQATIATLFDLQGRTNAASSCLSTVIIDCLGAHAESSAIVLPPSGSHRPAGVRDGDRVRIRGLATGSIVHADRALVVVADGDAHRAVSVATETLTLRSVAGLDPTLGIVEVTGAAPAIDATPVDWAAAVRLGQLALSHELIGASRAMLDMARQHSLERIQFGQPIAGFQAVRHRLAETLVTIETAQAMVGEAWEDDNPLTTSMAKALAGKGARAAARHAQQVLAGIGFTLEHRFHRYFRRVLVLDEMFGSAKVLTNELGEHLIRTRQLPPVLPL